MGPKVPLDVAATGPRVIGVGARHAERITFAVGASHDRIRGSVERARQAALARAERALSRNESFPAVAAALGLDAQELKEMAPGQSIPGVAGRVPEIETRLFGPSVQIGDRGAIPVPTGVLVYGVSGRLPVDPVKFESEKNTLRKELLVQKRSRYRQSILAQLRETQNVEINPGVLGFE